MAQKRGDIIRQLPQERVVDVLRQRLFNLKETIARMNSVFADPALAAQMPSLHLIDVSQKSIASQIQGIQDLLKLQGPFLRSNHVHPTSAFPWADEHILNGLLRKKLAPDIDVWVDQMLKEGDRIGESQVSDSNNLTLISGMENWEKLWDWAGPSQNKIAREFTVFGDADESDDDEDVEEDVDMSGTAAPSAPGGSSNPKDKDAEDPMDTVLRFATIGVGRPQVKPPKDTRG